MYDHEQLNDLIGAYLKNCDSKPTRAGLAQWLSISHQTICNVINGTFNGCPYTDKPHINRIICNDDFEMIRNLFLG